MPLTEDAIHTLLSQKSISPFAPWSSNDEATIDQFYRSICVELKETLGVQDKSEWNHYGSGYASYVDVWLYKPIEEFHITVNGPGQCYAGLVLLFSRLSHYYVAFEAVKCWQDDSRSSSYLPCYESIDNFSRPAVMQLLAEAQRVLQKYGLVRLHQSDLSAGLSPEIVVPTILTDPPYHQFDALFYWED